MAGVWLIVLASSLLFVVVSRIQRIGYQPEKTTLHGGQSRSWSAEQGKKKKKKSGSVLNTVPESVTPDSKENKQADAGSRRFRRHFLCGALLCNFASTEHEGLSTHVQRECSAETFMRSSILSLRIFTSCPGSHLRFFIKMQIQYSY